MAQERRDNFLQGNLSSELPAAAFTRDPDPDPEPAGPVEIADEILEAFLPDDDLEPLPEPEDFWLI